MKTAFRIQGPFPAQYLRFRSLTGAETLSQLYQLTLTVVCTDKEFDVAELLGKELTVVAHAEHHQRYLSGLVSHGRFVGAETATERYYVYEVTLVPWLWLATQTNHYTIYQKKTAVDVIQQTLANYPFEVEWRIKSRYREWGYCVQYDETDFEFISRLMEHEGLYYWFEHQEASHRLVIADDYSVHQPMPVDASLKFYPRSQGHDHTEPHIYRFQQKLNLTADRVVLSDYNLNKPTVDLTVEQASPTNSNHGVPLEHYHAMGDYTEIAQGEHYAQVHMDILEAQRNVYQASTNSSAMRVGHTLQMQRHPNEAHNQSYLTTQAIYDFAQAAYATNEMQQSKCEVQLTLLPATTQYRQPRLTPIPRTYGPQTARVVGPAGESIWTDELGRVKVRFHWDNALTDDAKSSCWVRVSSPWAGGGFGGMQIPRVDEEVIVDFLGGHPDRPIIVGRLYNAQNMPPVDLPAQATISGFHTRTKDGDSDQANSLLFEDAKGNELLKMVAQNAMDYYVKNDSRHQVDGDSATNIAGAHHWSYGGLLSKAVTGNATYQHEKGHQLRILGDSTDTIQARHKRYYTGPNTETIQGTEHITVSSEPAIHTYSTGHQQQVTGLRQDEVAANHHNTYDDIESIEVAAQTAIKASAEMYQNALAIAIDASHYDLQSGGAQTELSVNSSVNAGTQERQAAIQHTVDASTQLQEKVTGMSISATLVDEKLSVKSHDSYPVKINAGGFSESMQAIKMSASAAQIKLVKQANDTETAAINLTGIDFSNVSFALKKHALKLEA